MKASREQDRKAYMEQWRANHPEYGKQWRADHKIERAEYNKQWWANHKLEGAKHNKRWRDEHPLYVVWGNIKQRCYNTNRKSYKWYGGRGIIVCKEWLDYDVFEKWALENGWNKLLTIDRIDNNGNYEPSNCHFVTREENSSKGKK